MTVQKNDTIGSKGQKWQAADKANWLSLQSIKRSYQNDVLSKLFGLKETVERFQYGALSINAERYPLFAFHSKEWQWDKKTILITGGVHGYETSGVHGAICFLETEIKYYSNHYNIIVVPCVSPWAYETINRWNPHTIDPNRSFYDNSPAEESQALIRYIRSIKEDIFIHVDLHETTDTDNSEFRPALAARDAEEHDNWSIPDGFYLVGDSLKPESDFQKAIISAVEKTTHIAPADYTGKLIGVTLAQKGVINYAGKALGLCMGLTEATYVTTTEVYPDSPLVDDENCILAQVAAITSALDYGLYTVK